MHEKWKIINYFLTRRNNFVVEYPILADIPFQDKYIKYEKDGIIYIKLRFNDINKWSEYLSEIFGRKNTIFPDNISENKAYNNKYKQFKSEFVIT